MAIKYQSPELGDDGVRRGTYAFRSKRRKTLSTLAKTAPPLEEIVDAIRDLASANEDVRYSEKRGTHEVTVHVRQSNDDAAGIGALEAVLATINSLNLSELDLKPWNCHSAIFYRLRNPLTYFQGCPYDMSSKSLSSPGAPPIHAFGMYSREPYSSDDWGFCLSGLLTAMEKRTTLVTFCMSGSARCRLRCTCWDKCRKVKNNLVVGEAEAYFGEITELLASRRQNLKAAHLTVLGIMAFGEVVYRSPRRPGPPWSWTLRGHRSVPLS
ncbi:hypothetical protein Q8F55_000154 [Vanrija albida]|uniref:Uncharacterized protein n=1 Tax=Vanrija albida TaxID=181172 RepID=A0ABR3QCG3_9TREE